MTPTYVSFTQYRELALHILIIHNYYQQPGGEDLVFASEMKLLEENGHTVTKYTLHNDAVTDLSKWALAKNTLWNHTSYREIRVLIQKVQPDIVHVHNTFMLISPSVYYAAKSVRIPVVQTLHNFRLLCPASNLYRDQKICEDCLSKFIPWPAAIHRCYRKSRLQTLGVIAMLTFHRWCHTWQRQIDIYIALTEFARTKFIEGGLPPDKIVVKPNFTFPDPGLKRSRGRYALFVGRLTEEKGLMTMIESWHKLDAIPLKIVGDGPLKKKLAHYVDNERMHAVELLGYNSHEQTIEYMKSASFLVFPSQWYEGFPMTISEAFACGLPVIAARLGAMAEIVEHEYTGLLFDANCRTDLSKKVHWAWDHPDLMEQMGRNARREYQQKYMPEKNYQELLSIYLKVTGSRNASGE
ncbi:MAG: glycosyltransferase family 4 protein [Chloroflexota bacterium]